LVIFFRGLTSGILIPILPLYLRSIGVGVLEWGLLVSTFGVAMISTEALWGLFSDKIGKETVFAIGMFSMTLITPSYTLTSWMPFLFALQFLRGAMGVAGGPASRALLSDLAPAQKRGSVMGMWYTTRNLGQIVGSILGTYIATATTFAYSFYLCAISSTIGGTLALTGLRRLSHEENRGKGPSFQSVKEMLTKKLFQVAFALAVILLAGNALIEAFLPIFAIDLTGATTTDVGISLATFNIACVATTFLLGRASDKFGRSLTTAIGMTISAVAYLSYMRVTSLPQMLLATMGGAVGFSLAGPALLALLTDITSPEEYGTAMGIYGVFEDVGVMTGPLLYGFVWKSQGLTSIFYVSATLEALGVILTLMLRQRKKE